MISKEKAIKNKDIFDSSGYAGYTQFKGEIADYDVRFWRVFMKWIFL